MGKCYKLFKGLKTQIEAQMTCSEQNGILTKPLTYIEIGFLEAFVNYMESITSLNRDRNVQIIKQAKGLKSPIRSILFKSNLIPSVLANKSAFGWIY